MKSDADIQKDVQDQLQWDPFLNAAEIGVSVKNGIVTLSGQVDSYLKKITAERLAKKIKGVKAVAEDIQVGISAGTHKTDAEIAQAVLDALKWNNAVQEEKIKIKVEDGIVTLDGEVEWEYQRNAVVISIENLTSVRSINNFITIKPKASVSDVKQKINAAFKRSAIIDAENVFVEVKGNTIILRGKVRSFTEKDDAEKAAWSAPGISNVENKLELEEAKELAL